MAGLLNKWANLRAEGERLRIDFIRTELETCRTFNVLAATEYEIGDREAAEHCIGESEKAYRTVFRFLPGLTLSGAITKKMALQVRPFFIKGERDEP